MGLIHLFKSHKIILSIWDYIYKRSNFMGGLHISIISDEIIVSVISIIIKTQHNILAGA